MHSFRPGKTNMTNQETVTSSTPDPNTANNSVSYSAVVQGPEPAQILCVGLADRSKTLPTREGATMRRTLGARARFHLRYHIHTSSCSTEGISTQKHNAKFVAFMTIVSPEVLAICTGLASASGPSTTTGVVHVYEADTDRAADAIGTGTATSTVVLTGAITDYGIDHHGSNDINTLDFGLNGSFQVDASAAEN
jgi:hypothetical protein